MADPFSDMSAAGEAFIAQTVEVLELRARDPAMTGAVERYLDALPATELGRVIEVGAGSGPVARQVARRLPEAAVLATEPAAGFLPHARRLAEGIENLTFAAEDGTALSDPDGAADLVIQHTVLSHVADPAPLLAEAWRVLRPGGWLVVFDGDFSSGQLSNFPGDPLAACAEYFRGNFVTDANLCGTLTGLVTEAGFEVQDFWLMPRLVRDNDGMLVWVRFTTEMMVDKGQIGPELAAGLMAEYARRRDAGTLLARMFYATLIARKPG
jgi:SAM-dependent methyltransferase